MSIEKHLQDLTAALTANTAAILGKPALVAQAPAAKVEAPAAAKAPETAAKAAEQPAEQATELTYDDVKVPFLALVKVNRDLALKTIGAEPFKLASLKDAQDKPQLFPALLKALKAAMPA